MNRFLLIMGLLIPLSLRAQDGDRVMSEIGLDFKANTFTEPYYYILSNRGTKIPRATGSSRPEPEQLIMQRIWGQDYGAAVELMEKAAIQNPKKHGWVGETYLKIMHDYARALPHLDAYDALTPNFDDNLGVNPVSYLRGLVYRGLGDQQRALEQFTIAIDPLAEKHGAEWVNYRHFISRAVSYVALGQPEKALADLDKSLRNFNRSALAQYHRGRALLLLHRDAEARTAFQDASFFYKALRVERTGDYQEDDYNPVYEPEIEAALDQLKPRKP